MQPNSIQPQIIHPEPEPEVASPSPAASVPVSVTPAASAQDRVVIQPPVAAQQNHESSNMNHGQLITAQAPQTVPAAESISSVAPVVAPSVPVAPVVITPPSPTSESPVQSAVVPVAIAPAPEASPNPMRVPTNEAPIAQPVPSLSDAANDANKKHRRGFSLMAAGAVGALCLLVIGTGILINRNMKQSKIAATEAKQKKIEQQLANAKPLATTPVPVATTSEPAAASAAKPATTAKATTAAKPTNPNQTVMESKCFKMTLPLPNSIEGDQNDCSAGGTFGADDAFYDVTPITQSFLNMTQAVVFAKAAYKLDIISERSLKIGGLESYEIIYKFGSDEGGVIPTAKLLVNAKDKGYTNGIGEKITGFEINMTADTAANKAALATLESTWAWK